MDVDFDKVKKHTECLMSSLITVDSVSKHFKKSEMSFLGALSHKKFEDFSCLRLNLVAIVRAHQCKVVTED